MKTFKKFLIESSMNRVGQHLKEDETWAIITAWRQDVDVSTAKMNCATFVRDAIHEGYSVIKMSGTWDEGEGIKEEWSYMVIPYQEKPTNDFDWGIAQGKLFEWCKKQCVKYSQNSFSFKEGTTDKIKIYDKYGKVLDGMVFSGNTKFNMNAQHYTRLRGKPDSKFEFQ